MSGATNGAQSAAQRGGSLEERWKSVQSAAEKYESENNTQTGGDQLQPVASNVGSTTNDVALEGDDAAWQSAMDRFEKESTSPTTARNTTSYDAVGVIDDDYRTPSQMQSQDQRRVDSMDRMGGIEIQQSATGIGIAEEQRNESTEKLTLWQTFLALYQSNPMVKYYIIILLILLIATAAIIGVSVSQNKKSSSKDCASASYSDEQFLILPEESESVRASEFGISISASSKYLVVGSPGYGPRNLFENSTVGGGAYMYKRNSNNGWALFSSFVLDDSASANDRFGQSVAIAEDSSTVAVGAPDDDGLGTTAGAVYVMEKPFASTTPPTRLVSNDIGFNDELGGSVGVSTTMLGGDVKVTNIVAGASSDDDWGTNSGAVYVFSKFDAVPPASACGGDRNIEVGKWIQCQKLVSDDGESQDRFGMDVDISGRTIVVGAMWDDDRGIDSGAAYVFSLGDDGNWSLQQKLYPISFEPQANRFGIAVATNGDHIVVGADLDPSQGEDSGAAYFFSLSDGVWNVEKKLIPTIDSGTEDHRNHACGYNVDISNDGMAVVVGCPGAPGGGTAYIYNMKDNQWTQTEKLSKPAGASQEGLKLGSSLAFSDDGMTVVGYGETKGEVFSYRKDG